jgi:hypothetical protein
MNLRHLTARSFDNRAPADLIRWREAEVAALRRRVAELERENARLRCAMIGSALPFVNDRPVAGARRPLG